MATILPTLDRTVSMESINPHNAEVSILLVDDDERYLKLCERYLSRSVSKRFQVHSVGTLSEALAHCSCNHYDCLVVDYLLPDGTGTDLIEMLVQDANRIAPPAIITTSDGGEDAATLAIRAGAVDFISKRNLNSDSLSRSILNAVDKFRLAESLKLRNAELVQANDSLLRNRHEIMHFYHTVSHEVKTPLAAAREFISLLKDGAEGQVSNGQDYLLQLALDSCDQIKKQFSELLDMTRLESGKLELKPTTVAVENLIARSVTSVSELARTKQVAVRRVFEADVKVSADADRIVQVLSNLLHNAVKFSHDGGEVVLRTQSHSETGQLELRVEDSGCGIAEDELETVFNRLYQNRQQCELSSHGGLGLGLAIAKDIVELHGDRLGLTSNLNEGSTFYFHLPIVTNTSL